MAQVFPDSTRVAATWFTGNLIVPDGQRVTYVHMGYGSQYERYRVVRVERGLAAPARELSHGEFTTFRQTQFEAFRKTTEYRDMLSSEQTKAGADSLKNPADIEGFMYQYAVAEYMARIFE
jgi:hypothetical protein